MRKLYFMLLVMLGIFMMPESSLACGKTSQKKNCTKEITTSKKHKDTCCENKDSSHSCKGKCKNTSCVCPVSSVNAVVFMYQEFANNLFPSTEKRLEFYHTEADFASGFHSIWQPPKIG
ncbi:hypothetical protein ABH942_001810 [Flavobacterium sp. 28YEA47A]|uniref:hypothetical protein n=1 Tax=Flavobacterium sp. 28YEA47A TaxID=3156276 RepID=UPI00351236AC